MNSVDFCCNIIYEKLDNLTETIYRVEKPSGVESYIDYHNLPKHITQLFPFGILVSNLTCEDLNFTIIAYERKELNNN